MRQWRGAEPLLDEVSRFHRVQLHRRTEAAAYLYQRGLHSPELIERMRARRPAGLVTAVRYDTYVRRIVFPLEGNLYGRSLSMSAPPFCRDLRAAFTAGS